MDPPLTCNARGELSVRDLRFSLLVFFIGVVCHSFASPSESPLLHHFGFMCYAIACVLFWAAYWRANLRINDPTGAATKSIRRRLPVLFKLAAVVYLLGSVAFYRVPEEPEFGRMLWIIGLGFVSFLMIVLLDKLIDRTLRTGKYAG
jgi:hypothetical protein